MDLEGWSARLKVFADATRVRLLALLEREELTVAELSAITRLAQPRVSTHLAKLKEAGLVRDRRAGVSAYYRFDEAALDAGAARALADACAKAATTRCCARTPSACRAVLATRAADQNWADSVAGDMERHYSPGRTWEALARVGAAAAASPATCSTSPPATACWPNCWRRTRSRYVCLDSSTKVVAGRVASACASLSNVEVREGDMHALPFADAQFDLVRADACADLRRQAGAGGGRSRARAAPGRPPAADQPGQARAPQRGRGLTATSTWASPRRNCASSPARPGWTSSVCETVTREKRPPHFEVLAMLAESAQQGR